jgi:hypothetical protein
MKLRRTAIHLHLKTEGSLEQAQAFTGWRGSLYSTKFRLQALNQIPEDICEGSQGTEEEIEIPNRKPPLYQPGDGYIHGFFARSQPLEEIQAVLAEDIQGLEEQIVGLRALGRGLFERQMKAGGSAESIRMLDLYGRVAGWLSVVIQAEGLVREAGKEKSWVDEYKNGGTIRRRCDTPGAASASKPSR